MMLYLTGANSSLNKSGGVVQTDPQKSLGGFVSISPVPNGELNSLFDLISSYSLEKQREECIAIALINELNKNVGDITLKISSDPDSICRFEVAAVKLDDQFAMESIPNRYALPLNATFHDATFFKAYGDIKILSPASPKEEARIFVGSDYFEVVFGSDCNNIEKTIEYIINAFEESDGKIHFDAVKISNDVIRITEREFYDIELPRRIYCYSSDTLEIESNGLRSYGSELQLGNLKKNEGIGLWIKRKFNKYKYKSNDELVKEYLEKKEQNNEESFDLIISWEETPKNHNSFDESYNESYN